SHGAVYALWKTAEKYGFIKMIDVLTGSKEKFGVSAGEAFVLASLYRYLCNDENTGFMEWVRGTTLPELAGFDPGKITDDLIWHYTEKITDEQLSSVEAGLTKIMIRKCRSQGPLYFTHGSYFNFITAVHQPSPGKTRPARKTPKDKPGDKLNQYNLEIVMERSNQFPLSSRVTKNSLYSVKPQPNISDEIHDIFNGIDSSSVFTIVFDRTANAHENIRQITEAGFNYICAVSVNNAKDLVEIPADKYEMSGINGSEVSFIHDHRTLFSSRHKCVMFFSQRLKENQIKRLNKDINEKIEKLEILREQLKSNLKGSIRHQDAESRVKSILAGSNTENLISVRYSGRSPVTDFKYEINEKVYDEICSKYFGKKLLITNNTEWSAEEIISSYLSQSEMERMFKYSMKLWNMPMKQDFVWTDLRIRVHIFCCMLGFTLCGLLGKELENAGIKQGMETLVKKLDRIRETSIEKPVSQSKNRSTGKTGKKAAGNKLTESMSDEQECIWNIVKGLFE
ncbi:MAG: hypothetical protein PHG48_09105, partial [Eubacteriales bacterium]|nr:hypothetical protein [Eubacteriales bacterium]